MILNKDFLKTQDNSVTYLEEFGNCLNAHGLYNSMQFVLKLSPINQEQIDLLGPDDINADDITPELIQSFSTYLHENIHWWQHKGSITGFLISMCYPAQFHINLEHLQNYLKHTGPIKPIYKYNSKYATEYEPSTPEFQTINIILNNFFDIEFFKSHLIDIDQIENIINDPLFESIGHSMNLSYNMILSLLSDIIDPDNLVLPNPELWIDSFNELNNQKIDGYFYGSRVVKPPVGVREIFEGQARFNQILFLYHSSSSQLSWDDFEELGFLEGVYTKAFKQFLILIEEDWPTSLNSPLIPLFLLVCDISINPSAGFPFDIDNFAEFISDNNPGIRFANQCLEIRENKQHLKTAINRFSNEEYHAVSEEICSGLNIRTPFEVTDHIKKWIDESDMIKELYNKGQEFDFDEPHYPIKLLFYSFLSFNIQKTKHPEFFCWPGAYMVGDRVEKVHKKLFLENLSIFTSDMSGSILPRNFPHIPDENLSKTYNYFYAYNILYGLVRQWIVQDGEFILDFSWFRNEKEENEKLKKWAPSQFEKIFGTPIDSFKVEN